MLAFSDVTKELNLYVDSEKKLALAEGKAEGIFTTLVELVKENILTLSQAAQKANMSVDEFETKSGLKSE